MEATVKVMENIKGQTCFLTLKLPKYFKAEESGWIYY